MTCDDLLPQAIMTIIVTTTTTTIAHPRLSRPAGRPAPAYQLLRLQSEPGPWLVPERTSFKADTCSLLTRGMAHATAHDSCLHVDSVVSRLTLLTDQE